MSKRVESLGQGEKVASAGALVLFACMFLSWFNFSFETQNAWESLHFISPILSITIAATLGIAFNKVSGRDLGDIPEGLTIFVLGCLSVVLVLFRLVDPVSTPAFEGGSTSASVEAGAFLGLLATAAIAVGGYMATDSEALERLKRLMPSGGGPGTLPGGAPPPPPPPPPPEAAAATPVAGALPPLPAQPEAAPAQVQNVAPAPTTAAAEGARFCESCGSPVLSTDRFCGKCGQRQNLPGEPAG